MSIVEALVAVVGLALIVGELWFFLRRPRSDAGTDLSGDGVQEVHVLVKNGYHPHVIPVEAGTPVRLVFYRDETADCSARLVFDGLDIERELRPFEKTTIEFTPIEPGDYQFRCGMSVMRGRVVAEVGREAARSNLGKGHVKHG